MTSAASTTSSEATSTGDTAFYFALAFLLTWLSLLPPSLAALGVLPGAPETYMAGAPLAIFGPAIAAVVAARREGGRPAVRAMLRGLRAWKVGPVWYVLALTLPGLVYTAGRAVYALVPGGDGGAWVYLPTRPEHVVGMILVPIGEEIGWRGFALPRLWARHGGLRATAYLGVLWGLWHLPMFLASHFSPAQIAEAVVYIAVGNVMFSWFYRRTGGSLLLAVLLHVGAHLDAPTHGGIPQSSTPLHILVGACAAFAVALLVLDRRAFEGTGSAAPAAAAAS
jgi:membrane protease YdiL (CAAX protease family)